jgi:uncharacterized membrane protein
MSFKFLNIAALGLLGLATFVTSLQGCEVNNSSANDQVRFGFDPNQGPSATNPPFQAARAVIFETCISCHAKWKNFTQDDYLKKLSSDGEPLLVAGDLANSQIYQRIKGVGPFGDMPDNSTTLSVEQRQIIGDWILSIERESTPPVTPPEPPVTPPVTPPEPPTDTPEMRFTAAREMIMSKCMNCHAKGSEDGDFESLTEAGYLSAITFNRNPLVVAGNADASELFYRLKGIFGNGDMPRRRAALTPAEADVLRNWINKIGQK